jgi:protein-tyrosine-phosphatase
VDTGLEAHLRDASGLLFLCSANMVRSAFAELYARHVGIRLPLSSAATVYHRGSLLAGTAEALVERGVPPDELAAFRHAHIDELLDGLDERVVVLGMTRRHLEPLGARPEILARAHLLAESLGEAEEIPDPVHDGVDFATTFARIAECVEALERRLRELRPS